MTAEVVVTPSETSARLPTGVGPGCARRHWTAPQRCPWFLLNHDFAHPFPYSNPLWLCSLVLPGPPPSGLTPSFPSPTALRLQTFSVHAAPCLPRPRPFQPVPSSSAPSAYSTLPRLCQPLFKGLAGYPSQVSSPASECKLLRANHSSLASGWLSLLLISSQKWPVVWTFSSQGTKWNPGQGL